MRPFLGSLTGEQTPPPSTTWPNLSGAVGARQKGLPICDIGGTFFFSAELAHQLVSKIPSYLGVIHCGTQATSARSW